MARPVKVRTERTYRRDVEHLTRLRAAIQLDVGLPRELKKKASSDIDTLIDTILELLNQNIPKRS